MGKWVRWSCPVTITKDGRFQIMTGGDGRGEGIVIGPLSSLLEHLRYTKKFSYYVKGHRLYVEYPFEPGPNVNFRMMTGQKRATTFLCKVEYFRSEQEMDRHPVDGNRMVSEG